MKKMLILLLLIVGCEQGKTSPPSPPPAPKIEVQFNEDSNMGVNLRISFANHMKEIPSGGGHFWRAEIDITSIEELTAYEKEVQFLLTKIKETKEKMAGAKLEPVEKVKK